jgi:hypothetical protein
MQAESELAADAGFPLQAKRRFVTQSRLSARYGRRADRKKAAGGHISKLATSRGVKAHRWWGRDQAWRSPAQGQVLAVRPARRRGADARARRQGLARLVAASAEGDAVEKLSRR